MSEQIVNGQCAECGSKEGTKHSYRPICGWHKCCAFVCDGCWLDTLDGHTCPPENKEQRIRAKIEAAFSFLEQSQKYFQEIISHLSR